MLRLRQIGWRPLGGLKMLSCSLRSSLLQVMLAEEQICASELRQNEPLSSFPWLERASHQEFEGEFRSSCGVEKQCSFDADIVAGFSQSFVLLQFRHAQFWGISESLPKLIALVKYAGVARVPVECSLKRIAGLGRVLSDIEVCNAQVAPRRGERRIQCNGI